MWSGTVFSTVIVKSIINWTHIYMASHVVWFINIDSKTLLAANSIQQTLRAFRAKIYKAQIERVICRGSESESVIHIIVWLKFLLRRPFPPQPYPDSLDFLLVTWDLGWSHILLFIHAQCPSRMTFWNWISKCAMLWSQVRIKCRTYRQGRPTLYRIFSRNIAHEGLRRW